MRERLLFALTGHPGSGKTEGGDRLVSEFGFARLPGSDYLKAEAAKEGLVLTHRSEFEQFQRKLRVERSASFITDLMLDMSGPRIVSVGIRNRFDVTKFLDSRGILIACDCPPGLRFERTVGSDPKHPGTFEEFIAVESAEYNSPDPYGIHTQWAMDQATHTIDTSGSKEKMYSDLDEIVARYSR